MTGGEMATQNDNEEKFQTSRLQRIDNEIRSASYPNSEELALKLEVTSRTILRDIEFLRLYYDAPIEYDAQKRGFYYTDPTFYLKDILFTDDEFKNITVYYEFLSMGNNDEFRKGLRKVFNKIFAAIPEEKLENLPFTPSEKYPYDFLFGPTIVINGDILYKLKSAISENQVIEMDYWVSSNKKISPYTIEPLYTYSVTDIYYLLALESGQNDKPKIFSINRIMNVRTTDNHFEVPPGLRIHDYFKKEAGHVSTDKKIYTFELSFPKEVSGEAINRTYHFNETIELREDGTLFVSFRTTQLYDVFSWVLKQGHKVKVLNPPELVSLIKREAQKIASYYL